MASIKICFRFEALLALVLLVLFGQVSSDDFVCPDVPSPDEHFYPHLECSKYYVCQTGNLTIRECSIGLYFNPRLSQCDFPDAVPECMGGTRPPTTIRPTTEGVTEIPTTENPREWVVIQRRGAQLAPGEERQMFNLNWTTYVNGFGDPEKDFWLGLGEIARLTQNGDHELRIDMRTVNGVRLTALYDHFQLDEADDYRLNISGFSGTDYDAMAVHNGMKFSTYDRDNDEYSLSCSILYRYSAWWYRSCYEAHLNGIYYEDDNVREDAIYWYFRLYSKLIFTEMKIRQRTSV